ncbi:MAG: MlaD family protein [Bauldia sp.]
METRANHALIGAFTLIVFAIGAALVYWIATGYSTGSVGETRDIRLVITGPVTGLDTGNRVLFNGIQVGAVSAIGLDPDDPGQVLATIRVAADTPIKADTVASVTADLLSGTAYIQLAGGTAGTPNILDEPGIPTLLADATGLSDIIAGAGDIVTGVDATVTRLNTLIDDAGPDLQRAIGNLGTFTDALAANTEGVEEFLAAVAGMADTVNGLGARLETTIAGIEGVLNAVDAERVRSVIANADAALQNVANATTGIDAVVADIQAAAAGLTDGLDDMLGGVNGLVARAEGIIGAVDPAQVAAIVEGVTGFVGRIDAATANIDTIMANAQDAIAELATFAADINATRANIDTLLAAVDPARVENVMANVDIFGQQLAGAGAQIEGTIARLDGIAGQAEAVVGAVDPAAVEAAVAGVTAFIGRVDAATENVGTIVANAEAAIGEITRFATDINTTRANIDTLLAAVDPAVIENVMGNVDAFGQQLVGAGARIDGIVGQAETLIAAIDPAAVQTAVTDFGVFVTDARTLIAAVDADLIRDTVGDVANVVANIEAATTGFDLVVADARTAITGFTDLAANANETIGNLDAVIAGVDPARIENVVANIDTLGQQLAGAGARIDGVVTRVDGVVAQAETLLAAIDPAGINDAVAGFGDIVTDARTLIAAVDADLVRETVGNVAAVVERIGTATEGLDGVVADARAAVTGFTEFAANANDTLGNLDALLAGVDPARIATVVENIEAMTTDLRTTGGQINEILAETGTAIDNVTAITETLAARGGDIDRIIGDVGAVATNVAGFTETLGAQAEGIAAFVAQAQELATRLTASTGRLDTILADVETLFDAENAGGLFAEATAAATSIRQLADAIQAQTAGILAGINNFSTRGLADLSALIGDARVTMDRIDRFATELQQAPAQLLLGGGAGEVRDYNRR